MTPEIRTDRLILRPLRPADAGPIAFWAGRREVAAMTTLPHPYPPGAAETFIESARAGRRRETPYAIDGSPSSGPAFLGVISLKGAEADAERELGYWLGPPVWGYGYATEAAAGLLDAAFRETGLQAATTKVYDDNAGSLRVLEKLGFRETGRSAALNPARGVSVPRRELRLARADWPAARAELAADLAARDAAE